MLVYGELLIQPTTSEICAQSGCGKIKILPKRGLRSMDKVLMVDYFTITNLANLYAMELSNRSAVSQKKRPIANSAALH